MTQKFTFFLILCIEVEVWKILHLQNFWSGEKSVSYMCGSYHPPERWVGFVSAQIFSLKFGEKSNLCELEMRPFFRHFLVALGHFLESQVRFSTALPAILIHGDFLSSFFFVYFLVYT
jgi:hypothetical protein